MYSCLGGGERVIKVFQLDVQSSEKRGLIGAVRALYNVARGGMSRGVRVAVSGAE